MVLYGNMLPSFLITGHICVAVFPCRFAMTLHGGQRLYPNSTEYYSLTTEYDPSFISLQTHASLASAGFFYEGSNNDWRTHTQDVPLSQAFSLATGSGPVETINVYEIKAVLFAIDAWATHFQHARLVVNTDNTTAFSGLISNRLHGGTNSLIRRILVKAAQFDILIQPHWLPSGENALSRFKINIITNWCPHWQNSSNWNQYLKSFELQ